MADTIKTLLVDTKKYQEITGCGRYAAEALAREAKAKIKIGKKALYDVRKTERYLASNNDIHIVI